VERVVLYGIFRYLTQKEKKEAKNGREEEKKEEIEKIVIFFHWFDYY